MARSVLSPGRAQSTLAVTLVDEWARAGACDVVVCPGSRSTPVALAAARHPSLTVHVRLDERGAGFFAIGRALATARAVIVVVTSGTAAAELHAAVAEADLARVPLVVVTADRPPELHGVGAPQTIDQRGLFGSMVRLFEDPGVARDEAAETWRPLASRLWLAATGAGGPPGPVHLNLPLVEPLVEPAGDPPAGRDNGAPWRAHVESPEPVAPFNVAGRRVMAVAGAGADPRWLADAATLGWAVVGDATARGALPYADPLLRDDGFAAAARPDVVVRMGGVPASRTLAERVGGWGSEVIALDPWGSVADPEGMVSTSMAGRPDPTSADHRGDPAYGEWWAKASASVGWWLESLGGDLTEPAVARDVVTASASTRTPLVIASSMPIRDVEWWAPARVAPTFANRGANGIDGVVSTTLGVAAGGSAIGLVGDLAFLHDASALADPVSGSAVVVVVDNDGGGIFSFLPQASALGSEEFETLFGTPRGRDLVAVARGFGHEAAGAATRDELASALGEGLARPGLSVVVARVPDRATNVAVHEALVEGAAAAWRTSG
ncbi:MAG TPA: 2-succinyl-5-enolpyruvyl-6-hydroxy-3-cyclohexene-1-carboxylic-acid synthase [Acidimicrobiales bacterium]|nr:2-succinyl-5-enolpyruvyl-6-hydroxy-3-cyclohexene-1-carboxylic-acid synthase [Acidimicrobiales bacterium]